MVQGLHTRASAPNPPNLMKRQTFPTAPWVDVAIDFMKLLPSSDYLFVMVDYYSRYKEIKIMRTIAKHTIRIMEEIFSRLGFPNTVTTDNPQLISNEIKTFCNKNGIVFHTIYFTGRR